MSNEVQEPLVSGEAFKAMFENMDPSSKIEALKKDLSQATSVSRKDALIKQIKFLGGLKKAGMRPDEAYLMHYMPVLPPNMRPTIVMGGNQIKFADVADLYRDHMLVNNPLKEVKDILPPEELIKERENAYSGIKAIMGLGDPISPNAKGRGVQGLLKQISGTTGPKTGFFHSKILSKKQDFSGRATISARPGLAYNEAAVPHDMLWGMYKMHILRELSKRGLDYISALKEYDSKGNIATAAFNKVIEDVPLLINRAPTLMATNIYAVKPVPVDGKTIGINPLHLPMLAGDFDGDALSVFVPMTPDAVKEAKTKLLAEHKLNDYRKGLDASMVQPGHEAILGSMHLTEPKENAQLVHFKNEAAVLKALHDKTIDLDTPVQID